MTARRLLAAACCLASLAVLSACEKPAPIVTLVNAGQSVYTEASVYCFEGQSDAQGNCATRATAPTELSVQAGQPLGVDVAKELVERGWRVVLPPPAGTGSTDGQARTSDLQDGHYLSFAAPALSDGQSQPLVVRSFGKDGQPTGEWRFVLTPR